MTERWRSTMTKTLPLVALVVLAALAIVGPSAVMLVSVAGLGLAYWLARAAPLAKRLTAVAVAALLAGLLAEALHTAYHLTQSSPSGGGDQGGFFVGATLVGLINAAAFGGLLVVLDLLARSKRT